MNGGKLGDCWWSHDAHMFRASDWCDLHSLDVYCFYLGKCYILIGKELIFEVKLIGILCNKGHIDYELRMAVTDTSGCLRSVLTFIPCTERSL